MEIIEIIRDIAQHGQPPLSGIRLFSTGYEEVFDLLENRILQDMVIKRGDGVEKFVVGNYGTGKTHFLKQTREIAMDKGLFTAEVHLNKEVNHLNSQEIYREIAKTIYHIDQKEKGIESTIKLCVDKIRADAKNDIVEGDVDGLALNKVKNMPNGDSRYKNALYIACESYIYGQNERFTNAILWLEGNFADKQLSKILQIPTVEKSQLNNFCQEAILSLCKFIRYCGFEGSVIYYDEAEMTMNLKKKDFKTLLEALRQILDKTVSEQDVGLLRLCAFTPDVIQNMMDYPALQQRLSDPDPDRGFTEGNELAPLIKLEKCFDTTEKALSNFRDIGYKMVGLFCDKYRDKMDIQCNDLKEIVDNCIEKFQNASITARRDFMRMLCSRLNEVYKEHVLKQDATLLSNMTEIPEDEV